MLDSSSELLLRDLKVILGRLASAGWETSVHVSRPHEGGELAFSYHEKPRSPILAGWVEDYGSIVVEPSIVDVKAK